MSELDDLLSEMSGDKPVDSAEEVRRRVLALVDAIATDAGTDPGDIQAKAPARQRRRPFQEIFDEQFAMVERVIVEARESGDATADGDAHEAARSVVAQVEGLVLLATLLNDPAQLDMLWQNSLALLGAAAAEASA